MILFFKFFNFKGSIGAVLFYEKVLSDAKINAVYNYYKPILYMD